MDATRAIVEFVFDLARDTIPDKVAANAERSFIDTLACALAGSSQSCTRALAKFVQDNGGAGFSRTLGGNSFSTSPAQAALVNGTAAHALDYDDTYSTISYASVTRDRGSGKEATGMTVGHMGSCLLPALLALGEKHGSSGRDVLTAYVAGFEVACRLGHAIGHRHYAKGYHSTSTLGCMGAAAAGAKLLGLQKQELQSAFAIAASQASGLRGNFGTMVKPLQAGNAARTGVFAAELAAGGFDAPEDIIGSDLGFLDVLSQGGGKEVLSVADTPEGGFFLAQGNSLKFLPCANALQSPLETMLELVNSNEIAPETVDRIDVTLLAPRYQVGTDDGVSYRFPDSGLEGKFILPYGLAAALVDRKITFATYTDEAVRRPEMKRVFDSITLCLDTSEPSERLTIRLTDGREVAADIGVSKGHWSAEFPADMLEAKFIDCAESALPRSAALELYETVSDLQSISNVAQITELASAA